MASGPTSRSKLDPGERAVRWISNLTLTDDFAGQPFRLRPWQAVVPRKLFGTLKADGRRQYKKCFMFLPRKQAKTQLFAAIGVYGLLGLGKRGQEIDLAASDRKQASHLFNKAESMIAADPYLRKQVRVYSSEKRIEATKLGNKLQVLSSDGRRQHGLNPSIVLIDELHTQPNRVLYDALTSAQATRKEPLVVMISTAGNDFASLCYDEYQYACKVRDGVIDDPEYLAIIYEAGKDADWTSEETWHEAMPALGDFAELDYIRGECRKAKESRSEESKFRQLYLNQWVASVEKWLDREKWKRCGLAAVVPEELLGRDCYGGLDISNTKDITALVLTFPMDGGSFRVLCHFWIPEIYAREQDRKGRTKYGQWAEAGFITLTDGDIIDHDAIKRTILGGPPAGDEGDDDFEPEEEGIVDSFNLVKLRVDQFSATQIALQLQAAGLDVEFMAQKTVTMNEPIHWLEILLSRGLIEHGDNPVLNWMADNVVTEKDSYGNVKFSKGKSAEKIDGMVSLAMALAAAMVDVPPPAPQVIAL